MNLEAHRGTVLVFLAGLLVVIAVVIVRLVATSAANSHLSPVNVQGVALPPIDAGPSPHVVIEDADSGDYITPSLDGKVHVTDNWEVHGFSLTGNTKIPPIHLTRTSDGVQIIREPQPPSWWFIGGDTERTAIELPPNASVEVRNSSHIRISGINGTLQLHCDDGRLEISDATGAINASSNSGRIIFSKIKSPAVQATTQDGRILADNFEVVGNGAKATLHTKSGSVRINGTFAAGGAYDIASDDGNITLALSSPDLSIEAATKDGRIHGPGYTTDRDNENGDNHTYKFGNATGTMAVRAESGSIYISTHP